MQRTPCNVRGHPLSILSAAQTISSYKFFRSRYAQLIEAAFSFGSGVCIEDCTYFARFEGTYAGDRKAGKANRYSFIRERYVARNCLGCRVRRMPISLFLCCSRHTTGQHRRCDRTKQSLSVHVSRITLEVFLGNLSSFIGGLRALRGVEVRIWNINLALERISFCRPPSRTVD